MPANLIEDSLASTGDTQTIDLGALDPPSSANTGEEFQLKFRFSDNNKDVKLTCLSNETVLVVKRRLCELEGHEPHRQRWCFGGRIIANKLRLNEANIPKGSTVQVVVSVVSPSDVTLESSTKDSRKTSKPV